MSVQQKKWITIAVFTALAIVFTFAFFFDNNKPPSPQKKEVVTKSSSSQPIAESETTSMEESEMAPTQMERLSENEVAQSKELALNFVKAYAAFDAANPTQHIERAKPFMKEEMYHGYMKKHERGTLTRAKVLPETFEITNVSNDNPELIQWNVVMRGKALDQEGNERPEEDWYLVTMKKESGELKVVGVRVNLPN